MKKFLLSCALLATTFAFNKANAQCSISNVSITPTNVDVNTCVVTFNLSYTADVNGGSKYAVVHLWQAANYPSPAYTQSQYPLTAAQTTNMIGTILVADPGKANPTLKTSWPTGGSDFPASTALNSPVLTGGFSWTSNANGTRTYSFEGLQAIVSNCTQTVVIKGDVWATQNTSNASCSASGAINVVANEPGTRTQMICSNVQRSFTVSFNTLSSKDITFSVYKDVNGNGVYDQADVANGKLNLTGPGIVGSGTDVTISSPAAALNVYTTYGAYTWSGQVNGTKQEIFVVARAAGNNYDNVLIVENTCASLPVSFTSFTAARNRQTVNLKWETASEVNNSGFNIQRLIGNGNWETVAFVPTQAVSGNSTSLLTYTFNDLNTAKAVSQYRIQQVDVDGRSKYSQIRSVRADEMKNTVLLYPNPSNTGKVNVVFDDANGLHDVLVSDATGRTVKTFKGISTNNVVIEGLNEGFYSVQVIDRTTNAVRVEKLVIQKR